MLILKKINNNVALAASDAGEEIVVFGRGVGFPAMPYELKDESVIQRVFASVDEKLLGALQSISDEVLLAASDIVALAGEALDCSLSPNLLVSLADHIQYAVERQGGILIENPLSHEVAFVYPRERELGDRGLAIVAARTGVELPSCEATSIALHLVNAEVDGMGSAEDMDLVMKSTVALERITQIVEEQLGTPLDRTSYAYVRFVAHLRFLIRRLMRGGHQRLSQENLQVELLGRGAAVSDDAREPPEVERLRPPGRVQLAVGHRLGRCRHDSHGVGPRGLACGRGCGLRARGRHLQAPRRTSLIAGSAACGVRPCTHRPRGSRAHRHRVYWYAYADTCFVTA